MKKNYLWPLVPLALDILEPIYQHELLLLLQKGDESAFNEIYKAYSKPLYLRILRLVKNQDTADELLQEVFIRLWDSRSKIDPGKSFRAYLYTIAQNLVYNYFRKLANEQSALHTLMLQHPQHYLNVQQLMEHKEAGKLLQQAIEQLTPQRRQVFQLCKGEGKSYEEVSRIMGISVATVNSHMTQALRFLKNYLPDHMELAVWLVVLDVLR